MPRITLTQFTDFMFAGAKDRMKIARKIAERDQMYSYYEPFRDGVETLHYGDGNIQELELCYHLGKSDHQKRNLRRCALGYIDWYNQKKPTTCGKPPIRDFPIGDLTIGVNPELAVQIGERRYLIKLYWKNKEPRKDYDLASVALMFLAYPAAVARGLQPRLLSVQGQAHFLGAPKKPDIYIPILQNEAKGFLDYWNQFSK